MLARNLGNGPDQSWQPRKRPTQQSNRLSPMCAAHVAGEGVRFPRLKLCSDPWNLCCARGELRVPSVSLVKLQCSLEPLCSGERNVLSASLREDGKGEGSLRRRDRHAAPTRMPLVLSNGKLSRPSPSVCLLSLYLSELAVSSELWPVCSQGPFNSLFPLKALSIPIVQGLACKSWEMVF